MKKHIFIFAVSGLFLAAIVGCNDSSSNGDPYQTPVTAATSTFKVMSTTISNGATNVPVGTNISVIFSTNIDPSSVFFNTGLCAQVSGAQQGDAQTDPLKEGCGADTVKLFVTNNAQSQAVAIDVTPFGSAPASQAMTIKPLINLVPNTNYTLVLSNGLMDTNDNTLASSYTVHFKTAVDPNANPTAAVLIIPMSIEETVIDGIEGCWGTQSLGLPVRDENGNVTAMVPPSGPTATPYNPTGPITPPAPDNVTGAIYPNCQILQTTPTISFANPLPVNSPEATYIAVLPNSLFMSGQTYYFAVRPFNEVMMAPYSNEAGKTMP